MSAWWAGLPPAVARVECGGERHRVRWAAGRLQACDHDDVDGERTLAALGGARCTCVEVVDAWERHAADVRVLVLGPRAPTDRLVARGRWAAPPRRGASKARRGWVAYAPMSMPQSLDVPTPDEDLAALLALGGGVADRFVAGVIATWTARLERPDDACEAARAKLHAALYGRALRSVRAWLDRPDLTVDVRMVEPGTPPALTAVGADTVRADLPFAWLSTVWARNLTTLMGRFCLDATTEDGREWTLVAVDPDLGAPSRISVRL